MPNNCQNEHSGAEGGGNAPLSWMPAAVKPQEEELSECSSPSLFLNMLNQSTMPIQRLSKGQFETKLTG